MLFRQSNFIQIYEQLIQIIDLHIYLFITYGRYENMLQNLV